MLTKVCLPNDLATSNIIKFLSTNYDKKLKKIERIQDNMCGYLLIQYSDSLIIQYNYHLNKLYSHDKIQIDFNGYKIIKQINSFDQNNWIVGNRLRNWVLRRIDQINRFEFVINSILGIGGEYYLYWVGLCELSELKNTNLIGISNHKSIVDDAILNIPWSVNYLVDYNNLKTYPKIIQSEFILINLFQINSNVIKYLNQIKFKKIILIACNLPDSKLKLLALNFKLKRIKYFANFNNFLRVIEMEKK
jgi:hypothetical protein